MIEFNEADCLKVIQNSVLEDTLSFRTCDEVIRTAILIMSSFWTLAICKKHIFGHIFHLGNANKLKFPGKM